MMPQREHENIHDSNAVLVLIKTRDSNNHSTMLGHLERNTARIVATMIDHFHGKPLSTFSNHELHHRKTPCTSIISGHDFSVKPEADNARNQQVQDN